MDETTTKILEVLDALPEKRRQEVLNYVESLRAQEERRAGNGKRDPAENPLLDLIGAVDEELGADRIDEQLYGDDSA